MATVYASRTMFAVTLARCQSILQSHYILGCCYGPFAWTSLPSCYMLSQTASHMITRAADPTQEHARAKTIVGPHPRRGRGLLLRETATASGELESFAVTRWFWSLSCTSSAELQFTPSGHETLGLTAWLTWQCTNLGEVSNRLDLASAPPV